MCWLMLNVFALCVDCSLSMVETNFLLNWIMATMNCGGGCERVDNLEVPKIKVYLYNYETNSNDTYFVDDAAKSIMKRNDFDPSQCVYIFIPGFANTNQNRPAVSSRCAFAQIKCNGKKPLGLIIDHSDYTNNLDVPVFGKMLYLQLYQSSVRYAKSIGKRLGRFVVELLARIDRSQIDVIGHSLGGHISGYMGDVVRNETGKRLKSIYAVDPAGPCYDNCPGEHVNSKQADLVVTFHCNTGQFGTYLNLSHYDFYSGNGVIQDNCGPLNGMSYLLMNFYGGACSHVKCLPIVYSSGILRSKNDAVKCSSADAYLNGACSNNEVTTVGFRVEPKTSRGVYYFTPSNDLICDPQNIP